MSTVTALESDRSSKSKSECDEVEEPPSTSDATGGAADDDAPAWAEAVPTRAVGERCCGSARTGEMLRPDVGARS